MLQTLFKAADILHVQTSSNGIYGCLFHSLQANYEYQMIYSCARVKACVTYVTLVYSQG